MFFYIRILIRRLALYNRGFRTNRPKPHGADSPILNGLHSKKKAQKLVEKRKIKQPRLLKVYMDDTFGIRKKNKTNTSHVEFMKLLSEVDENLKFTVEIENDSKLPFLDTLIIREKNGTLKTAVYRKPSNTRLTINPKSSQDPEI